MKIQIRNVVALIFVGLALTLLAPVSYAKTAKEIDVSVDVALERIQSQNPGTKDLLKKSKAVLVFPAVYKIGFGLGGEYGEGALRVDGKTAGYYNTIGGSFGFQFGAQAKRIYVFFLEDLALKNFQAASGWRGIADASAVFVDKGANDWIDTLNYNAPVVTFVEDQRGLMFNLSLEGAKYNKLAK